MVRVRQSFDPTDGWPGWQARLRHGGQVHHLDAGAQCEQVPRHYACPDFDREQAAVTADGAPELGDRAAVDQGHRINAVLGVIHHGWCILPLSCTVSTPVLPR